jgi:SAM-dependent methyltransferase
VNIREAHREVWTRKLVPSMQAPDQQSPPNRVAWTVELLPKLRGATLADIGTGSGSMLARAASLGYEASGIDFDGPLVEWLRGQGYPVDCVDASSDRFPWGDSSIDVVTCCDVIEHLIDPFHALAEARRILKPGGWCFVTTANYSHWKLVFDLIAGSHRGTSDDHTLLDGGHVSYWGAEDLGNLLERCGFGDVAVHYRNVHKCPDDIAAIVMRWAKNREWIDCGYQIAVGRQG